MDSKLSANVQAIDLDQAMASAVDLAGLITQTLLVSRKVSMDTFGNDQKNVTPIKGLEDGVQRTARQPPGSTGGSMLAFFDWLTQSHADVDLLLKSSCLKSAVSTQLAHFQRQYDQWRNTQSGSKEAVEIMLERLQPQEILAAADSMVAMAQGFQASTTWLARKRAAYAVDDEEGYRYSLSLVGRAIATSCFSAKGAAVSAEQITRSMAQLDLERKIIADPDGEAELREEERSNKVSKNSMLHSPGRKFQ